jgi:hypothetical protein
LNDISGEHQLSIASAMAVNVNVNGNGGVLGSNKSGSVIDLTGVVDESHESSTRTTPRGASATPRAPEEMSFDLKSEDAREQ